jgi:signal-transduction protein with cAMP-binding, CBS, and nucleotidyltransferase domain
MADQDDHQPKAADHQTILVAHMMTPGVVQIPGDVSVTEAASLLERERMPCLLVKDTESRFGLMTPTDIVKKVVAQGLEPDNIEVRTIMTRPVQFIEYDRAMDEASALMMSTGTPILIVTKQDQPVGVLTARDLILSPKRCITNISATISIMEGKGVGDEHQGVISQLSHAGALVESPMLLLPGTKVILSFCLSETTSPLTIRGTVLNNERVEPVSRTTSSPLAIPQGVEIQFTDLSPADQSRIKAWVLTTLSTSLDAS